MKVKLTVLCENSVVTPFGVIGEHGFSAYIETENGNFLFDTGQGKGLINNANVLGIDLKKIDFLCISHGHYDHTLGIPSLLTIKSPLKIYAHENIFANRYWLRPNMPPKFIGIPFRKEFLETLGAKFEFIKDFTEVKKGIYISGEVPRDPDYEMIDPDMKIINENGEKIQDTIIDDFSMAIDTDKGLVIILGCAHAGIVNILNYFIEKTGKEKIYAVVGGTHLGFANEKQLNKTLEIIEKYNIQKLGASHCTGLAVSSILANMLKDKFFFAGVGAVLEV